MYFVFLCFYKNEINITNKKPKKTRMNCIKNSKLKIIKQVNNNQSFEFRFSY